MTQKVKVKRGQVNIQWRGQTIEVYEPGSSAAEFNTYLDALPGLVQIAQAQGEAKKALDGEMSLPAAIPDTAFDSIATLLKNTTNLDIETGDDVRELSTHLLTAILNAFWGFAPNSKAETSSE